MTAPKLTAASMLTDSERPDWLEVVAVFEVTPAQRAAFASLLHVEDGVRVTVEAADAPVAAPRRRAEEIAREMVRVVESKSGGWSVAVRNSFLASHAWKATAAEDSGIIEAEFVRLIEQGRAEGAAAALAGQQPRDLAGRIKALEAQVEEEEASVARSRRLDPGADVSTGKIRIWKAMGAIAELREMQAAAAGRPNARPPRATVPRLRCACDHRDDNACSLREDYFGASEGCACDCHRLDAPKPRDLAGRIRALAGEWTDRYLDAKEHNVSTVCLDIVRLLRRALRDVAVGEGVGRAVEFLRTGDIGPAGGPLSAMYRQAADELTRIMRECEEKR